MPKAYIVTTYRSISNPDALAEYAKLVAPPMIAAGGRFLARGSAAKAYEADIGSNQRLPAKARTADSALSAKFLVLLRSCPSSR
jgi:uncharacterized protein (DUF1330 family)